MEKPSQPGKNIMVSAGLPCVLIATSPHRNHLLLFTFAHLCDGGLSGQNDIMVFDEHPPENADKNSIVLRGTHSCFIELMKYRSLSHLPRRYIVSLAP